MTTGEGGVVTTGSPDDWRLLVSLRNHGRIDEGGWFDHVRLGFNYRLDDLSAALGIAQVERLEQILALRRAAAERYGELAGGNRRGRAAVCRRRRPRALLVRVRRPARPGDRPQRGDRAARRAGRRKRPVLPCIDTQGYMRERYGFREGMFPVAEDTSRRTLALPFFTLIERDDQEYVVNALRTALGSR